MKPYYSERDFSLFLGDARELCSDIPRPDLILADPPYASTSLDWDKWQESWPSRVYGNSMWCFGTLRMFMERAGEFYDWKLSQDVIWEKHNGSSFHADRFRRVHEQPAHFYRGKWEDVYHNTPRVKRVGPKVIGGRRGKTPQLGSNGTDKVYKDDGFRLQRSVIQVRSEHGRAQNETQKPLELLKILICYACPPGGLVLSPFCGSGSDLVAAKQLGMKGIGIDIRESELEVAAKRLSQEVLNFGSAEVSE